MINFVIPLSPHTKRKPIKTPGQTQLKGTVQSKHQDNHSLKEHFNKTPGQSQLKGFNQTPGQSQLKGFNQTPGQSQLKGTVHSKHKDKHSLKEQFNQTPGQSQLEAGLGIRSLAHCSFAHFAQIK